MARAQPAGSPVRPALLRGRLRPRGDGPRAGGPGRGPADPGTDEGLRLRRRSREGGRRVAPGRGHRCHRGRRPGVQRRVARGPQGLPATGRALPDAVPHGGRRRRLRPDHPPGAVRAQGDRDLPRRGCAARRGGTALSRARAHRRHGGRGGRCRPGRPRHLGADPRLHRGAQHSGHRGRGAAAHSGAGRAVRRGGRPGRRNRSGARGVPGRPRGGHAGRRGHPEATGTVEPRGGTCPPCAGDRPSRAA